MKKAISFLFLFITILHVVSTAAVLDSSPGLDQDQIEQDSGILSSLSKRSPKQRSRGRGVIELTAEDTHSATGKKCVETMGACETTEECCGDICKRKMCKPKTWLLAPL